MIEITEWQAFLLRFADQCSPADNRPKSPRVLVASNHDYENKCNRYDQYCYVYEPPYGQPTPDFINSVKERLPNWLKHRNATGWAFVHNGTSTTMETLDHEEGRTVFAFKGAEGWRLGDHIAHPKLPFEGALKAAQVVEEKGQT